MTNRRASLNFKLDSEVASKPIMPTATSPERTKVREDIDANYVVRDDELWADFQQRLRQSKHNVTAADTRRMFQEFLLEKKQKAAAEQKSTSLDNSIDESPTTEAQKPPSSLVETAANSTASSAKNFFRRMSMISSASSGHGGADAGARSINSTATGHSSRQPAGAEDDDAQSRRGSLGSLGSLGALYNNIVGELSDSGEDDSDGEDLLGRMVDTLSSSPGRLGMLQKFGSERHLSSNHSLAAKEAQSNRCIYQMAQEVGNASSGIGASNAQSDTSQGQRARQGRRGSIADRLAQVAALAKVSLEDEIDGEDDGHDNDGHGAYSGLR